MNPLRTTSTLSKRPATHRWAPEHAVRGVGVWRGAILPVATLEGGSEWVLPVQGVWRICGVALTAGCFGVSSIKLARVLWGLRAAEVRSTSQKEGRRLQKRPKMRFASMEMGRRPQYGGKHAANHRPQYGGKHAAAHHRPHFARCIYGRFSKFAVIAIQ